MPLCTDLILRESGGEPKRFGLGKVMKNRQGKPGYRGLQCSLGESTGIEPPADERENFSFFNSAGRNGPPFHGVRTAGSFFLDARFQAEFRHLRADLDEVGENLHPPAPGTALEMLAGMADAAFRVTLHPFRFDAARRRIHNLHFLEGKGIGNSGPHFGAAVGITDGIRRTLRRREP